MTALILALGILTAAAGGAIIGRTYTRHEHLTDLGLTPRSAHLYRQAADILTQLAQPPADLNGDFNLLTEPTRRQVTSWLDAYRKDTR